MQPDSDRLTRTSEETLLSVAGMHCNNCASTIEKALADLPGIERARASFALEEAQVRYDPERASLDAIVAAIRDAGFDARPASPTRGADRDAGFAAEAAAALDRRRKMVAGLTLSALIMLLSMGPSLIALPDFSGRITVIFLAAAVVQFYVGAEYFLGAYHAARLRTTTMDTLVALGSSVAFFYSSVVFLGGFDPARFPVYFESAAMIVTLVMVGKFLEARARRDSGSAVRELLAYQPDRACVVRGDSIAEVDIEEVERGEIVQIRPGEKIPLDGEVVSGSSHVDESMLSGESAPIAKRLGNPVYAGTLNQLGAFRFEVHSTANETVLASLIDLVRRAQASRAPIQTQVDRVAALFVPAILAVGAGVGLYWWAIGSAHYFPDQSPVATGLVFCAATLLISCPCAMGLATPLALIAGTGVGAKRGLLIKSATALERAGDLTSIVLDKTGTLTLGRPSVLHVESLDSRANDLLREVAAVETASEHPLARALVEAANALDPTEQTSLSELVRGFEVASGRGVRAELAGVPIAIGNRAYLIELGIRHALLQSEGAGTETHTQLAEYEASGSTVVFVARGKLLAGWIAIGDAVDPASVRAVERLERMGLAVRMATGDSPATARAVAREIGLAEESIRAGVLPADKAAWISALQGEGERVAMVGDGINDAPALAAADVGIAIGRGTDIAIEAADIVLIGTGVDRVADVVELSRRTLRTIRQNLFWAFAYNVAAIPLAAGMLVPWLGESARLSPGVAAGAMALSSLFVAFNSARLRNA